MRKAGPFRALAGVLFAATVALSLAGPGARVARAATPTLTMVTSSTYTVLPEERRIAVSVEITATSLRRDTTTRRYTIDRAYLAVLPTASNFRLIVATGAPKVTLSSQTESNTVLLLRFGSPLGSGKSMTMTLTFDILDPGGAPDRALRITPSLLAFPVWAFGSVGVAGSSVRLVFPADYVATIGRGPLVGPSIDEQGQVIYESGPLSTPETFVADVLADRPGVLLDGRRSASVAGGTVIFLIRSWPDDPDWRKRVTELLQQSLPVLAEDIGLAWPWDTELEVRETIADPEGGAAAGAGAASAFDDSTARLDIPYTADPSAILHGAAHGWFNARLVADRWIAEGFASLYSEAAGATIGVPVASPEMTDALVAEAAPLNSWLPGGAGDGYGYAASVATARAIQQQAGDDELRQVWIDAAAGVGAYQPVGVPAAGPAGTPQRGLGPADWRSLLDLLEAKSDGSFEGIWRRWVVRPADARLLDVRYDARALYDATVAAAGPWVLPSSIRAAMGAWAFDAATEELLEVAEVLEQRDDVGRAAAAVGLAPSDAIRRAFEGSAGLATAGAEAVTERAVIGAFEATIAARPAEPDLIASIGLIGTNPEGDVEAARAAFAAGDLDATVRLAVSARSTWAGAPEIGRGRLLSGATISFAMALLLWLVVSRRARPTTRAGRGSA